MLGYPLHLKYVDGKLKNKKFAILMHVKRVSNVTFHHLFNRCLPNIMKINVNTRMWANAQPDGRPAEHRWRPLFNAAKFG